MNMISYGVTDRHDGFERETWMGKNLKLNPSLPFPFVARGGSLFSIWHTWNENTKWLLLENFHDYVKFSLHFVLKFV